jgi:hypothetical protein
MKIQICKLNEVAPGESRKIEVEGRPPIAVFNVEGSLYCTDDTCTHGGASLTEDGYLLDEPSLGLSPLLVEELFGLIGRLHEQGLAILLVEQNVAQSLEIAQRAYVLENGIVQFSGTSAQLLATDRLRQAYLGV